ncbi:helix-turn-helix domain-containing protein [Streptomyces sp. NPDC002499]
MDKNNRLSEFLRARRALTRPEDHGMPSGTRRTPGLRREEVAVLAGVSTDYYVRLEQGRERNPSPQVLGALAAALLLADEEAAYLRALVDPPQPGQPRAVREYAGPQLVSLLDAWPDTPALVYGRYLDLLAVNSLGEALFSWLDDETSLITAIFLNPAAHDFHRDWDVVAQGCVAALRAANPSPDDQRLRHLVGELSVRSHDFARMWARHEVRAKTASAKRFHHPLVGELTLNFETFSVHSAPGQHLVVYRAEPGSPAEQSLALLGSYTLTEFPDAHYEGHIPHDLP